MYRKIEVKDLENFFYKHIYENGDQEPISIKSLESWTSDRDRVYGYGEGKGETILFTVSGKDIHAIDISKYSKYPEEKEAVNLYASKFSISSRKYHEALGWQLTLVPVSEKKSLIKKSSFDYSNWMFDKKEWQDELEALGGEFIKEMYDQIGKEVFDSLKSEIAEQMSLVWNIESTEALEFIENYSLSFAEQVSSSVEEELRDALKGGIEEGLDINGIASMVENIYDGWKDWKAELIAVS